jgi:hypothetical protein
LSEMEKELSLPNYVAPKDALFLSFWRGKARSTNQVVFRALANNNSQPSREHCG